MRSIVLTLLLALSLLPPAAPLHAQAAADSTGARVALFDAHDLWWAGGFALGTVALFPLDRYLANESQDSTLQAIRIVHSAARDVEFVGRPGSFLIGGALYGVGRLSGNERMADLGLHGSEAIILADLLTRAIKGVAGRARPLVDVDNPTDFQLFRGFSGNDYQSFPSGHTSVSFAAAAAVTAETGRWWPDLKPWIGTAMFGGATLVALSRMYHNKHWASDVMAGAAIGTFAGWKVVRYNHSRTDPHTRLDRWMLGLSIVPAGSGRAALLWVMPAR